MNQGRPTSENNYTENIVQAVPLSEQELREEENRVNQEKARLKQQLSLEEKKGKAWTQSDLEKFILENEIMAETGTGRGLMHSKGQIDTFYAEGLREKKLMLDGKEKTPFLPQAKQMLYGLVLARHLGKDFYITSKGGQPVLHDVQVNPDSARIERMKGLQDSIKKDYFRTEHGNIFASNDNYTEATGYLTTAIYHENKGKKSLADITFDIQKRINPDGSKKITPEDIMKSGNITALEKSYLLGWVDEDGDITDRKLGARNDLEKGQRDFVTNARESIGKANPEKFARDLIQNPFTVAPMAIAAGGIGIALLASAVSMFKKEGFFTKIGGLILGIIGGALALPAANNLWKATGAGDALTKLYEGAPLDRKDIKDNDWEKFSKFGGEKMTQFNTKRKRFMARHFSGTEDWTGLLMQKEVGPKLATYPAGAMLWALYEGSPDKQKEFAGYKDHPQMKEIQETLKNLDLHTDRPSLLGLLSKSWERQKTLYPEKITDDATKAASEQMSLATIIDDIDDQDNWYNEMPTWLWLPDIFRGNDKKTEALKIMAPNIEKWGDLSLENIEKVYNPLDKTNLPAPTEPEKALLDSIGGRKNGTNNWSLMRAYFSDILTSANNHNIDKKVSLRDFMQQEKATLKKTASKPNEETGEARETAESWTAMKKKLIEVVGRERMKKLLQDEKIGYWFDEGGIPLAGQINISNNPEKVTILKNKFWIDLGLGSTYFPDDNKGIDAYNAYSTLYDEFQEKHTNEGTTVEEFLDQYK